MNEGTSLPPVCLPSYAADRHCLPPAQLSQYSALHSSTPLGPPDGSWDAASSAPLPIRASDEEDYDDFPTVSLVTALSAISQTRLIPGPAGLVKAVPTKQKPVSVSEREAFVLTLPTRVQVKLNQPFGKDNLVQCFQSEACLRHVLLPLYKSGFLARTPDWTVFAAASASVQTFLTIWDEHRRVDFRPLQGFHRDWDAATSIDADRVRMATAALLHFDGDIADVVRWIGGTHVGAHRDVSASLAFLRARIDSALCDTLERIWRRGSPSFCNASATEANFQAYRTYGNHASVNDAPEVAYKTLLKDSKRGYCLLFDKRMVEFALNCHVTPNGLVDVDHPHKNPRPIFDASFRPEPWCSGINDWTSKTTEPPVLFATAFDNHLWWVYNMRITYPDEEIYLGDDDVSGAFRHQKYHPNLVGMHSCVVADHMSSSTGLTFGDTSSPANFDPVTEARKALARYLWFEPDTVGRAAEYLPAIELAPPPPPCTDMVVFVPAQRDSLNTGVLDDSGDRLSPRFEHHVDDALYADTARYMLLTISACALARALARARVSEPAPRAQSAEPREIRRALYPPTQDAGPPDRLAQNGG